MKRLMIGAILILVMIFMPSGLFCGTRELLSRLQRRKRPQTLPQLHQQPSGSAQQIPTLPDAKEAMISRFAGSSGVNENEML